MGLILLIIMIVLLAMRLPVTFVMLALGMDAVNRLFSNDNPILRAGRDLGLGVVNAVPGLRRRFMRQAAGLSGPLPRLMAGRAL